MDETFINNLAQALRKVGTIHTVGEEWCSYTGQIPNGGIPYCGQEVTRETYSALWDWANAKGLVKSESEWQSIASSQNGNVPFYSVGNGSSTFRVPRIVGYVKGASSLSESGSYTAEGLPTHTHTRGTMNITGAFNTGDRRTHIKGTEGAIYNKEMPAGQWSGTSTAQGNVQGVGFDASRAWTGETSAPTNSLYGKSAHVTPETSTVLFGVYAFGVVVGTGELDAANLASAIARVETSFLPLSGGELNGLVVNRAGDIIVSNTTDRWTSIKGGTNDGTGGFFTAYGKDSVAYGSATIGACDGTRGSQFSVRPSGYLELDGKFVEVIAAKGNDWVRFDSGTQICWGSMSGDAWVSFQQPFADLTYSVTIAGVDSNDTWNATVYSDKSTSAIHMWARNVSKIEWMAIGRWK